VVEPALTGEVQAQFHPRNQTAITAEGLDIVAGFAA
jgi:hypothetical protein